MKGPGQIKTDVYKVVQENAGTLGITGVITKRMRPLNSELEDICIKVVSNDDLGNANQEAVFYVNVYVPDVFEDGQYQADDARIETLEFTIDDCFGVYNGGDFRWELKSQTIEDTGAECHVICNKFRYYQNNL